MKSSSTFDKVPMSYDGFQSLVMLESLSAFVTIPPRFVSKRTLNSLIKFMEYFKKDMEKSNLIVKR